MEYITIPGTDLKASRIGLGTWAIGGWLGMVSEPFGSDEESGCVMLCFPSVHQVILSMF